MNPQFIHEHAAEIADALGQLEWLADERSYEEMLVDHVKATSEIIQQLSEGDKRGAEVARMVEDHARMLVKGKQLITLIRMGVYL